MSNSKELGELIAKKCDEFSLYLTESGPSRYRIWTGHVDGISLIITVNDPRDFNYYYLARTEDVCYHGDRTDAHVILGLMFASFLRINDPSISCSLFDIPHPRIDDEIWGRYIVPIQDPIATEVRTWDQLITLISHIISLMAKWRHFFWFSAKCPCPNCSKETSIDNIREYEVPVEINDALTKVLGGSSRKNFATRARPGWSYLYDIEHEVTIIKSDEICSYLEHISNLRKRGPDNVEGINGRLILDNDLNNFLSSESLKEFRKLFKVLFRRSERTRFYAICMENMIVGMANPYIVALGRLSGLDEFRKERELVRERHNRESAVLFPVPQFDWAPVISPDQFEDLVKALLEREQTVKSVRKASPTNQSDKGRDFVIEWSIPNPTITGEKSPPSVVVRVVGQCKASVKSIGKDKVRDIRDTVETHNATGFFLAVSSQVSAALTEKLEALNSKGIWTQWWNRDDIEMRLSRNQDLLPQFSKLLKARFAIKFVEMDGIAGNSQV